MFGFGNKDNEENNDDLQKVNSSNAPVELQDNHMKLIDTALKVQGPLARKYVRSLKQKHPSWSNEELHISIESKFRTLLTVAGAGIGGAAALPGVGTVAAIGLTLGEGAAFAEACAFLTLAVAEIYNVDMRDNAQRRTVTLALLGGEAGAEILTKALGKQGAQWNTVLAGKVPDVVMNSVNKQVKKWIQRKMAAKAGGVWAGRLMPFGIGAIIGGFGNNLISKSVIEAERKVFASIINEQALQTIDVEKIEEQTKAEEKEEK